MRVNPQIQAYWSEQSTLWESSGLAQRKFCEQQSLAYKQFVYWRERLNRNKVMKSEPRLLAVSSTSACLPIKAIAELSFCLEVILSTGIWLYIEEEAGVSRNSLKSLLHKLKEIIKCNQSLRGGYSTLIIAIP